jgi:hypothetical protein
MSIQTLTQALELGIQDCRKGGFLRSARLTYGAESENKKSAAAF